jgi:hypothetical protein
MKKASSATPSGGGIAWPATPRITRTTATPENPTMLNRRSPSRFATDAATSAAIRPQVLANTDDSREMVKLRWKNE